MRAESRAAESIDTRGGAMLQRRMKQAALDEARGEMAAAVAEATDCTPSPAAPFT